MTNKEIFKKNMLGKLFHKKRIVEIKKADKQPIRLPKIPHNIDIEIEWELENDGLKDN